MNGLFVGIRKCLFPKLNNKSHKLYYQGPYIARKQVCRNYDVIPIMMLIVNSRVLESFKF